MITSGSQPSGDELGEVVGERRGSLGAGAGAVALPVEAVGVADVGDTPNPST